MKFPHSGAVGAAGHFPALHSCIFLLTVLGIIQRGA